MSTRQDSEAQSDSLLQAIYEISHEISVNLANEHVLHNTCRQLTEALKLDYVCVARDDPGAAEGVVLAEHPAQLGKGSRLPLEEFGAYHRLQSYRKPVAIAPADAETGPLGPNQPRFEALNLQTLILIPLLVQDDLIGFMILAATQKARTFSQDVMYAIQVVAAQLAISLRNTELFTEIQRRANQLDQLTAFGRMVTSTLDRDMILQHVIEVVPSLLPADHLSVALLSARQPRMRVITLIREAPPQEEELAAAGSSIEEVVRTQNPILITDLQSSAYTDHRRMVRQGLRSVLVAPLIVSGHPFGAVNVAHQRVRMYTPTDLTLFQQIGNQIAIALENAHQFQTTQQRAQYEESLSQITSHLQQQADLRVMLQQTMQDLGQILGARRARVRLQITPSESGSSTTKE